MFDHVMSSRRMIRTSVIRPATPAFDCAVTWPEVFLTWVANRTHTMRIGHGVVCMPFNFNHPVRVAERAAMLDLLSGGRLDLGAGRGGTEQETSRCGVDRERTAQEVEEALRIIGKAWQEEELEYHGELIDIDPHPILPGPRQTPHPPLFLASSRAETLVQAAELGVGALVMGFAGPESIGVMRAVYDGVLTARDGDRFGSTAVNDHFSVLCPTIVLADPAEARRIGVRGQRFFAQSIGHWYGGAGIPDEAVVAGADEAAQMRRAAEQVVAAARAGHPGAADVDGHVPGRPRVRERGRRHRVRAAAQGCGGGRDHVPDPDGHRAAGSLSGDLAAVGREGHPALPHGLRGRRPGGAGRGRAST